MTTGYTAPVEDGTLTDFRTFALRCAREFGYLTAFRDAALAAPLPETVPPISGEYYAQDLMLLGDKAGSVRAMTLSECREAEAAEYAQTMKSLEECRQKDLTKRSRLQAMLDQVNAWQAPMAHARLKNRMIEQLSYDLEFEAFEVPKIDRVTPEAWRENKLAGLERQIEHAKKRLSEERLQAEEAAEWLRALRESLP